MVKFVVTNELGRLCRWLRLLGYDALYYTSPNRSALIVAALRDARVILTRDAKVSTHRGARVIKIKSDKVKEQLGQVIKTLRLKPDEKKMFCRCIICNEELVKLARDLVKGKVPEYVFKTQENFVGCPACQRTYWAGTHWGNAKRYLDSISEVSFG